MIPLERLGEYSDGIERINIELSIKNKLALCDALIQYLQGKLPVDKMGTDLPSQELLGERANHALAPRRAEIVTPIFAEDEAIWAQSGVLLLCPGIRGGASAFPEMRPEAARLFLAERLRRFG